jgi:hypothetical protein
MKRAFPALSPAIEKQTPEAVPTKEEKEYLEMLHDKRYWLSAMNKGGFEEGLVRIVMALEDSDHAIDRDALWRDERLLEAGGRFGKLDRQAFIHMAQDQSRFLQADEDEAVRSLTHLIATPAERKTALAVAKDIVAAEAPLSRRQKGVLARITKALDIKR